MGRRNSLNEIEELVIGDFNISSEVPSEMEHWNNRLEPLQFVPLVALKSQLILPGCERSYVPGYVVAPSLGLHPVNTTCRNTLHFIGIVCVAGPLVVVIVNA